MDYKSHELINSQIILPLQKILLKASILNL